MGIQAARSRSADSGRLALVRSRAPYGRTALSQPDLAAGQRAKIGNRDLNVVPVVLDLETGGLEA